MILLAAIFIWRSGADQPQEPGCWWCMFVCVYVCYSVKHESALFLMTHLMWCFRCSPLPVPLPHSALQLLIWLFGTELFLPEPGSYFGGVKRRRLGALWHSCVCHLRAGNNHQLKPDSLTSRVSFYSVQMYLLWAPPSLLSRLLTCCDLGNPSDSCDIICLHINEFRS